MVPPLRDVRRRDRDGNEQLVDDCKVERQRAELAGRAKVTLIDGSGQEAKNMAEDLCGKAQNGRRGRPRGARPDHLR